MIFNVQIIIITVFKFIYKIKIYFKLSLLKYIRLYSKYIITSYLVF